MSNSNIESEAYWNRIGASVLSELERRLGDDDSAADLPGTLLMRLAEQYLKYLDKKAQEQDEELHYMTAMEAIDQPGLPAESKVTILTDYITKLEADLVLAQDRLKEVTDDLQAMPESGAPE